MKLTRHNGRAGKNGVYNPKHNDRNFNIRNSDHIDPERVSQNVYWDCYHGFFYPKTAEEEQQTGARFELVEKAFYLNRYFDFCEAQHERNRKTGHSERDRDTDDLLHNKKTAPEESIIQIGTMDEHIPSDVLLEITAEFFIEFSRRFGEHVHILDWSLHMDEATPHIHERHVFDCENRYGEIAPQQEKALEIMDIPLPFPDKPPGKNNNRKITFDAICRTLLFDIAQKHDVHLDREPEYGGRAYLEKQDYILMRQKQKLEIQENALRQQKAILLSQDQTLRERHEEIEYRDGLLEQKEGRLREITVKLDDVEALLEEVADIAYEKAVETVTAEVIMETQNQELAVVDSFRNWVQSPKTSISKKEKETAMKYLDKMADVLRRAAQKITAAVRKRLLLPETRKQKTAQIRREARSSVVALLDKMKAEQAAERRPQPTVKKTQREPVER